jgi:hypothetical protein
MSHSVIPFCLSEGSLTTIKSGIATGMTYFNKPMVEAVYWDMSSFKTLPGDLKSCLPSF